MSHIPDTEKTNSDIIDLISDGNSEVVEFEGPDGSTSKQLVLIPKKIRYKTQRVNSNRFARYVKELESFLNLAHTAPFFMTDERAEPLIQQIIAEYETHGFSIDGKSSETMRDKHNNSSTLIDVLQKHSVERKYVVKDEMKRGILDGIRGKTERETAES